MQAVFNAQRERIQKVHSSRYDHANAAFHFHSHIELLWVRRGTVEFWHNDTVQTIHENELGVVLGYEAHRFDSHEEKGDFVSVFIPASFCPDFAETVRSKKLYHPIVRDAEAMKRIGDAIEILTQEELNAIEQNGYVHVILGTALKHLVLAEREASAEADLPIKLFFYINEHYKENISLDSIAAALGYSRHHLSKCFRTRFELGINHYINTLRLKNAIIMMRSKEKSITECALESGFGSMRTFYRVFEEEFGCSPREYLRQNGNASL